MRIRVADTWIAGDPDLGPHKSPPAQIVSWVVGRVIQANGGAEEAEISYCDRKQVSNQVTFTAVREFATPDLLLALLADHAGAAPDYGVECTVALRSEMDLRWYEVELTGTLAMTGIKPLGPVSAELSYKISGGALVVGDSEVYWDQILRVGEDTDYLELKVGDMWYRIPAEPLGTTAATVAPALDGVDDDYIVALVDGADYRWPAVPTGTALVTGGPLISGDNILVGVGGADYAIPLV